MRSRLHRLLAELHLKLVVAIPQNYAGRTVRALRLIRNEIPMKGERWHVLRRKLGRYFLEASSRGFRKYQTGREHEVLIAFGDFTPRYLWATNLEWRQKSGFEAMQT